MATPQVSRSIHVYDIVADTLVDAGVDCIFGLLGEDTAPLVVAAEARGIAYYPARHENQAVAMADGYSRATGKTGVATVTGGPGFSNALTAINTAHRASSRIVVLIGAGRPEEDDHDRSVIRLGTPAAWLKFFPQAATLDLLGIDVVKPQSASSARRDTRRAFSRGRHATVVLVLGRDLLLEKIEARDDTHSDAADDRVAEPPDPEQIATLVDLLQETWAVKRPLILAGRGAAVSGAAPALQRLGELTGALLSTTLGARALFHGDPYNIGICGSYATPVASELITQADCVLAFGAGLNQLTTYNNSLFPKALLVHVDAKDEALGRFLDAELAIRADARLVAQALVDGLQSRGHHATGYRSAETRDAIAGYRTSEGITDKGKPGLMDPRTLMLALDGILPSDRIICADAGQHSRFAVRFLGVEQPRNFMQAVDGGSIGLGIGTGIGAAIGRPGELVVVAAGDGGMMMSLGDLETAVRLRLPMLVVVTNDEALGSEVNILADLGMETRLAQIPSPSFAAIAAAMGAQSATVRSVADLEIVKTWLANRSDTPLVLDCRVNGEVRAF